MYRIGLVSDTHMPERCDALPASLCAALGGVDLLLHAGDVGELLVLDRLSAIAPVVAVARDYTRAVDSGDTSQLSVADADVAIAAQHLRAVTRELQAVERRYNMK